MTDQEDRRDADVIGNFFKLVASFVSYWMIKAWKNGYGKGILVALPIMAAAGAGSGWTSFWHGSKSFRRLDVLEKNDSTLTRDVAKLYFLDSLESRRDSTWHKETLLAIRNIRSKPSTRTASKIDTQDTSLSHRTASNHY